MDKEMKYTVAGQLHLEPTWHYMRVVQRTGDHIVTLRHECWFHSLRHLTIAFGYAGFISGIIKLKRNSRYWASTVCHEKSAVDESYKERLVAAYREELTPHEKHAFTYLMLKRNSRYWASTVCHETIVQCVADIQNHNVQPIHSHHTVGGS